MVGRSSNHRRRADDTHRCRVCPGGEKPRFQVGIEKQGTNPGMIEELIGEGSADRIFLDVKAPFSWEKYRKAIGIDEKEPFEKVKRSEEKLRKIREKVKDRFDTREIRNL